MPSNLEKLLQKYTYSFPEELIAQEPAHPRDSARLLVYHKKTGETQFDTFRNITRYLPKDSVLVFNQTKVIPARLVLKKETGGLMKILYLGSHNQNWRALSPKPLKIHSRLTLAKNIFFIVKGKVEREYILMPSFSIQKTMKILEHYGETPLPPYIKHSPSSENTLRRQYQTVFAKVEGSIAAPTASLHFTRALLRKIKRAGIGVQFITLHVNLGTFAPLSKLQVQTGTLHEEWYEISPATGKFLNRAKKQGKIIIAVGTTVARTLESAAVGSKLTKHSGVTNLFIREGYKFKFIDGLITNFHVPRSSLLMLVAALVPRKTLFRLYKQAIKKRFRLFSFGDGMLLLP